MRMFVTIKAAFITVIRTGADEMSNITMIYTTL